MISMSIFAILSVMAYSGLSTTIKNRDITENSLLRLSQLQLTMTKLHRDFEQLAARDATDGLGSKLLKLSTGQYDDILIQFTRNGWRNPAKNTRSHLQRVAYKLEDDKLIRMNWIHVDRAQDDQLMENELIDNLEEVELRFLDDNNSWQDSWPPKNTETGSTGISQPRAIEVKLVMNDWGDISRVFRTTAGSGIESAAPIDAENNAE